jgi:glycosyltransferase involved in cell wall biosynthesis
MISVVIPLYNKAHQIANTLQSVFGQTFTDFEIIIVDDGSTDNSSSVVSSINDTRIRLIHQNNAGVSAARNRGIAEANGEFVAFLDADDEWKPDYLATQAQLAEEYSQCDVFATNYEFCKDGGKVTSTIIRCLPFIGTSGILSNYFEVASNSHPPLWTSAVMVRKSAIESIGGFPFGIKSGEDLLTWARLACRYKIAYDTSVCATFIFDEKVFNEDQRNRRPETYDFVGKSLYELYKNNKSVIGLKSYVGLWHKMRCRIFLSKHCRIEAIKESFKALHYNTDLKYFVFVILSFLPFKLSNRIINSFS